MRTLILLLFCFLTGISQAQKLKKEDKQILENLKQHEAYLASDLLEGRRTGTKGEQLAAMYIKGQFTAIGLSPKGTNDFYQPFDIDEGKQIDPATSLSIDGKTLQPVEDYFPLAFSASTSVEASPSISLPEPKMPRFWDLKETLEENKSNPHFDLYTALIEKVKSLKQKGATAVFVYNTSVLKDEISFDPGDRSPEATIPVVYITRQAATRYFADPSASMDIKLKVSLSRKIRNGQNVIGFIDNGAASTIVLGAHYDHLGYGEDQTSLYRGTDKQIHNGADDNASGTAALIELARMIRTSKSKDGKNSNYLFIAFSGEELGLFGSKYFVEHPTVSLSTIRFMINMDMVGRLNDSSHALTIGGYGTSPEWGTVFTARKTKVYAGPLVYRFDSSGTGPSDHMSFYLKNIPVLFYFTGIHSDYHKPTDDIEKINFEGELQIIKHIYSLVEAESNNQQIAFIKTRDPQMSGARFSVTLGIIPDYTFTGTGVRVDGVSDNRPAQKAGLQTGDVITGLGSYNVNSLDSYMQALGKFTKGEKTTVSYIRGTQKLSSTVEF